MPTPDMPATGLGGSINLISRSGFESRKPKFSFNAYSMFHDRTGLTFDGGRRNHTKGTSPDFNEPSFDFSYLHPFNNKLAITLGGSRTWRHKPMEEGSGTTDEQATWDQVRLVHTTSQWNSLAQTYESIAGQIGIDWRISPSDTLSASMQYRLYDHYTTRSVLAFNFGAGATGSDSFSQGAATGVGSASMNGIGDSFDVISQTKHYTLRYRHRGGTWRADAAASCSTTGHNRTDTDNGFFNVTPSTIPNLILRGDEMPSSGGIIFRRFSATTRTGQPVNLLDGAGYSIDTVTSAPTYYDTGKMGARADLARDFTGAIRVAVKVGGAIDTTERDQRRFVRSWSFRPNGSADVTARMAGRFDLFDEDFNAEAPTFYGQRVNWLSGEKIYQLYQQQPSWFVEDQAQSHQNAVNNSRDFTETVSAAFLRTDWWLLHNRLWVVAGARFERTDAEGNGALNDINAQYQRNADGSFVRNAAGQKVLIPGDALALRKLRFVERASYSKRHYSGWYPSLNATFNLTDNLLLRAAAARTLGRPNTNFITPGATISEPDVANPTITINNTGLLPWTAVGYDLSLESYQIKDGVGSIGVFQKRVRDFFGLVTTQATPELLDLYGLESDPSLLNYQITTRMNVGNAKVEGVEFSYRQALTFLPHWARGIEAYVNATKLTLSGANTADFTGYNPKTFSGGISLVRPRFFIKATVSHLGDIPRLAVAQNATTPAGTFTYELKQTRIGLNAQYSLTKRYAVYVSLADLEDRIWHLQRWGPGIPDYAREQRRLNLGYYTNIGIRGTF